MLGLSASLLSLSLSLSALGGSAPGEGPSVGLIAPTVEGEVPGDVPERIAKGVEAGLGSGSFSLADVETPCPSAECHQQAAASASAGLLVRVTTRAAEPDYVVRFELIDPVDASVIHSEEASCDICTYDEVVVAAREHAASMVDRVAEELAKREAPAPAEPEAPAAPEEPEEPVEPEPSPVEPMESEGPAPGPARSLADSDRKSRAKPRVLWGGVLVGLGAPAIGGGIALIALEERNYGPRCSDANTDVNGVCEYRYRSLEGGIALTAIGAASAIAGVALIVTGRKKQRRVQASVGPGRLNLRASF